ncbi:unnamed protein product, partial [Anisakis simplex]|uniref:Putative wd40 protein (inferred by orthology to a S. mansoni protein) n=1 Tax=Anisakis simplex TaxID=6269 RepID=A0A0M3K468_ANISI
AKLERVIGCTASSRCSIAVDQHKGLIAYPAGSTVVLQNPNTGAQAHLIGTTKNNITCLAFSKCGGYLATGECGHEPRIRVWQLYDTNGQFCFNQLTDIKYHQIGIVCVRFTHEDKYILSIGNRHDKAIAIWDWRTKMKIAENRLTSKINSVDENEQGVYVTVGMRHVKFWHIALNTKSDRQMPLQGRSAILADHRNNTFVDVCCVSNNRTFSITETKMLVEFNDKKLVNTYDLNGEVPHSLVGGNHELFIGFNNGTIRCFDTDTVEHKRTYCKPHHFLCDIARGVSADALLPTSHPADARYPDVRALCYNKRTDVMTVVYSDRSIYNWKHIPNTDSYSKLSSQLFHVGSILSLEVYSNVHSFLPFGTFITGGVDETIRLWNVDQKINQFDQAYSSSLPPTNVYSEDLKKIIYLANTNNSLTEAPEQVLAPSMDLKVGAKSLRVSPDGQHLACGGRDGNLRVYDLTLPDTPMVTICEAHEAEIMCLEYSDPERCDHYLLASGSRDRLVHLFDPRSDYTPLTTIDDNHSTINSIVFTTVISGTSENLARDFCLITCAADRVITVHKLLDTAESSGVTFKRSNQMKAQFGLNHMLLSGDTLLTACQDRLLRSFGFNGKVVKQIKGTSTDDGQLTKVRLDPSGTYAATVCSDRNVYIVEASTGDCAAVLSGQSDSVTDVAFTNDCKRLIVVSYSGCIFVWRLSNLLSNKMAENLKKVSAGSTVATNQLSTASTIADRPETPDSLLGGTSSDAASERHQIAVQRAIPSKVRSSAFLWDYFYLF